jgi:hypothetical protein
MHIGFIDKKPAFGTCPVCHLTYSLRSQPKHDTTYNSNKSNRDNLTLNEKLDLLFIVASHDKNLHFRKREWVKKRDEVRKWLDNCRYPRA